MKKVKFMRVSSELSGYGLGKGAKFSFEGAEEIVRVHIEQGWEYKGYLPIVTRATGDIETMSLIFEREE